jgi:hypothetical protein
MLALLSAGVLVGLGVAVGYRAGSFKGAAGVKPPEAAAVATPVDAAGGGDVRPRLETREGRLAALALAEENEVLKRQVGDLQEQVDALTKTLAGERAEADRQRVAAAREGVDAVPLSPVGGPGAGVRLVDVNQALGMVVLGAGARQGIRPEMEFHLFRGQEAVARVRAVDVRENIAGAAVEEVFSGTYPRAGDRAVPGPVFRR